MRVDFHILGPIEALGELGAVKLGGPRQRAVLAILLLHANRVVPVEQIADDLYGDDIPATAVAQRSLRSVRALGDAVAELVADGDTVALEGFSHLIPFSAGHELSR